MAIETIKVPDLGGAAQVTVIEILVKPGDSIVLDQSIITLESEKASMDVPASAAGVVKEIKVKVGQKIKEGSDLLTLETATKTSEKTASKSETTTASAPAPVPSKTETVSAVKPSHDSDAALYAGPAVRRVAAELDIDLSKVKGTGEKGRITIEDVKNYLSSGSSGGSALPAMPVFDFSKWGAIETKALNKIKIVTGTNMQRNWLNVPHVTQFDEADITDLEAFRKRQKEAAEKRGIKLTPLVFVMKAVVAALKMYPHVNASLDASGQNLIVKKYFHIGVAVDTPNGLVVPVIRDVDQKGIFALAEELGKISAKAREKGLSLAEMQGGCFTISSLGGIGGTAFTPIVNAPEAAILGVSKAAMKPVYCEKTAEFQPRLMLPLSLSYDHRVIDGAEGARFITFISQCLSDISRMMLL